MITNVINLIIFTLAISSANKAYVGDVVYTGGTELVTASFKLYDQHGNLLYQIIHPDAITFFISDSGQVFATNEQMVYLYDRNGKVFTLQRLNFPNGFGFSPDNSLFFVSDRDGISAYAMNGKLVYQFNPGRLFSSTTQGKKMAIVSTDTLFFYETGELKFQKVLTSSFARRIYFSEDENTILIEFPEVTESIKIPQFNIQEE